MSQISARGIDTIKESHPQLHTALHNVVNGVNQVASVTGVGSLGPLAAPKNIGALSVVAGAGIHDVAINDPNPQRGETYFLEWDTNPAFTNAKTIPLGPARNWRGYLGTNLTVYWKHYKQLLGSDASNHITYGPSNAPIPVTASGTNEPAPQNTMGSGTSKIPGQGFGTI